MGFAVTIIRIITEAFGIVPDSNACVFGAPDAIFVEDYPWRLCVAPGKELLSYPYFMGLIDNTVQSSKGVSGMVPDAIAIILGSPDAVIDEMLFS